ncbi:prolyl endopeptidase FAP-like isoform X4 [Amphiura filiformis]|uniref:prolyl endopeptidase FAP-like isoform X4 n=1 Tax=Amphiura filiformis TaxID=82378 RepID=UPI003B223ABB
MAIYMDPEMMDKMNKLKAISEDEILKKLDKAGRLPGGSAQLVQQRLKAEAARAAGGSAGTTPTTSKAATIVKTAPQGPSKKVARKENVEDDEEELVGGSTESKNWKGIVISLLVILGICGLIVVAVYIITPDLNTVEKFTFEDIFDPRFKPKTYDIEWITGSIYIRHGEDNNLFKVDLEQNETITLIDNRTVEATGATKFWANANLEYILLGCNVKKLYRHSFTAVYKIYDVRNQEVIQTLKPPDTGDGDVELQYAEWSPAGTGLVFVYGNNVYYQEALGKAIVQLTDTGEDMNIFNGIPDWVYEEEMLSSNNAIYWNPWSSYMVFGVFNDTNVRRAWYPDYNNNIYSKIQEYPYPKAGETNPTVKLYVQSLTDVDQPKVELKPPDGFSENVGYYYQSVTWVDKHLIAVVWTNRPQNYSVTTICQFDTGACLINHDYVTPNGWVVMRGPPVFAKSGDNYVYIYPNRVTGVGNYFHIALNKLNVNASDPVAKEGAKEDKKGGTADERVFLTQGEWEVTEILGYNEGQRVVYYVSTETSPHDRHLYNVSIDEPYHRTCLSCNVRKDCTYFDVTFSKDLTWYRLACLGPGIPQTTLHNVQTGDIYMAESNQELTELLAHKSYPVKVIDTVKTDDGRTLHIQRYFPGPDLGDIDPNRKHPLLIDVYGGPGSQSVNNIFQLGWNAYLSSRYYMIVASIDGRGAGFYGEDNLYAVYKKLGTVEIEDQIKGVQYLIDNNTKAGKIDRNKIAIWGWSYGGFATTSVLGRGSGLFKCGIAVAPVTDWRYYDSIYTERYMATPDKLDNLQAYINSNVSDKVSNMHNSRLLLIHGTADDNVHFQNSADLVRALVEEEIQHQVQYYTEQQHLLENKPVQLGLYRLMSEFLWRRLVSPDRYKLDA